MLSQILIIKCQNLYLNYKLFDLKQISNHRQQFTLRSYVQQYSLNHTLAFFQTYILLSSILLSYQLPPLQPYHKFSIAEKITFIMQSIHQSNQPMQLQQSQQSVSPLSNLQKFLNNYNKFISQNLSIEINSQQVINDISSNILQPPQNLSENSQDLLQLYTKGKQLTKLLDKESQQGQMQQMIQRLKKLKEDKIYQTVMFIEQLNYKLNKEYQYEVNRGIENGVYSRKAHSQNSNNQNISTHRMEGNSAAGIGSIPQIKVNLSEKEKNIR